MRRWMRRAWFRLVGNGGVNRVSLYLHPLLYRWPGGRGLLGRFLGNRVVLMTSVGAQSGRSRTVPIWAYPDGSAWVVVGSRGGDRRPPAWYHNLRAHPTATLEVDRERLSVRALEAPAGSAEYERLWAQVEAAYAGYAYYQERAGRHIPLMILEPGLA